MQTKKIIAGIITVLVFFGIISYVLVSQRNNTSEKTANTEPTRSSTSQTEPQTSFTPTSILLIGSITEIQESNDTSEPTIIKVNDVNSVFVLENTQITDKNNSLISFSTLKQGHQLTVTGITTEKGIEAKQIILEN